MGRLFFQITHSSSTILKLDDDIAAKQSEASGVLAVESENVRSGRVEARGGGREP